MHFASILPLRRSRAPLHSRWTLGLMAAGTVAATHVRHRYGSGEGLMAMFGALTLAKVVDELIGKYRRRST